MSQPFNSVADVRRFVDELNNPHCPVALRTRELRDERERERREVREVREQQQQAANNWESWWNLIDERIRQHFALNFDRNAEGKVGPLTHAIGAAIGHNRAGLRKEFEAAIEKLRDEFRIGQGRVPLAKAWDPDAVCHVGDIISYGGETFQCLEDTGKTPAANHPHWRLLACRGRDGNDAPMLRFRGRFDVDKKYAKFDVIEYAGGAFVATRDNPAIIPGEDGWQCLALPGGRGPVGETGPRGQRGAGGARGEDGPTIIAWTLDIGSYVAHPTLSNGRAGAPLDLRPLFVQFHDAVILPALTEAVQEAARTAKLPGSL